MPPTFLKDLRKKLKSKSYQAAAQSPVQQTTVQVKGSSLALEQPAVTPSKNGNSSGVNYFAGSGGAGAEGEREEDAADEHDQTELSDTIDSGLITLWLGYCEQHHGAECSRRELEPNSSVEVDIIVIDTRRKCLVRTTTAARYFALSYVWGSVCFISQFFSI